MTHSNPKMIVAVMDNSDKDGSRGKGTGNRNGGVSSSGDGSGSSIGISGWNGSDSSGTCGRRVSV